MLQKQCGSWSCLKSLFCNFLRRAMGCTGVPGSTSGPSARQRRRYVPTTVAVRIATGRYRSPPGVVSIKYIVANKPRAAPRRSFAPDKDICFGSIIFSTGQILTTHSRQGFGQEHIVSSKRRMGGTSKRPHGTGYTEEPIDCGIPDQVMTTRYYRAVRNHL